jgi:mono/diheme cytochrome c family protein
MRRIGWLEPTRLPVLVALALIGGVAAAPARAAEPDGAALFAARCARCHAVEPAVRDWPEVAALEGPDLAGAGVRYRPEWLEAWLAAPTRLRPAGFLPFRYTASTADGDRVDLASIPAHPALAPAEAKAVAAYLGGLTAPEVPYPAAEPNSAIRAAVHFHKILPCGGCHRAGDGEGGVSGPDLGGVAVRLQEEWLRSFLWDPLARGSRLMPRVRLRADQVVALAQFLGEEKRAADAGDPPFALRPEQRAAARRVVPAGRAELIYQLLCAQCHGVTGDGRGIDAPSLFVAPRNHASYEEMSRLSDDHIFQAIQQGGAAVGKSSQMPSWGALLSEDDIHLLVGYLRRLSGTGSG